MPSELCTDYDEVKKALLLRYDLTEDGFRLRFRSSRPEGAETFAQHAVRSANYLTRWIEMADVPKTYDGLFDLMMRDQILSSCDRDLRLFLKERQPKTCSELTKLADQYREARRTTAKSLTVSRDDYRRSDSVRRSEVRRSESRNRTFESFRQSRDRTPQRSSSGVANFRRNITCYRCGKKGHFSKECRSTVEVDRSRLGRIGSVERRDRSRSPSGNRGRSPTPRNRRNRSPSANQRVKFEREEDKSPNLEGQVETNVCGGCIILTDTLTDVKSGCEALPQLTSSCRKVPVKMPECEGLLEGKEASTLRDTGCSGVVVRRSLIPMDKYLGQMQECLLADGTKVKVPVAEVKVDSPYFKGTVQAWLMENPIYDVIVGNIKGARDPFKPDLNWVKSEVKVNVDRASAVQTRAQKSREEKPTSGIKVPDCIEVGSPRQFLELQEIDSSLNRVKELASEGKIHTNKKGVKTKYFYKNRLLYREYMGVGTQDKIVQLVVPRQLRSKVLTLAHETILSGHMSKGKTVHRILNQFYWPGVQADANRFCRLCDVCQRTVPKGRIGKVPLGSMPIVETPFTKVAVDIVGPLTPVTERGNRYILTLVDFATRYPEAIALKNIETTTVAEALLDIFSRIGFPQEILSDQCTQFTSNMMAEVSRLISLKQVTTTPYHAMANGLNEKMEWYS